MTDFSAGPSGSSSPHRPLDDALRVLVVDDHPSIREAVAIAFTPGMDLRVCAEASTPEEALRELERTEPDIAIVDITLEDSHDLALVERIRADYGETRAVVYSTHDEVVYAERALRAGAWGYVMKGEPTERLIEAVRAAGRGEIYLSRRMATRVLGDRGKGSGSGLQFPTDGLTDREMEVFRLLGKGYEVDEIAEALGLAFKTVETYRRKAKNKLDLEDVSSLRQYALRWISVSEHVENRRA